MDKAVKLFATIFAFMGIFLVFSVWETYVSKQTRDDSKNADIYQKYDSKTDDQADVTVTVTPNFSMVKSGVLKFTVIMDTHSIELDQNMVDSAILFDEQNTKYLPLSWEGSVGGHHREGVLTFNQITTTPKSVELTISGVGGVDRRFTWQFD